MKQGVSFQTEHDIPKEGVHNMTDRHPTSKLKYGKLCRGVNRADYKSVYSCSNSSLNPDNTMLAVSVSQTDINGLLARGYISQVADVIAETSISTVLKGEIDMKAVPKMHPRLQKGIELADHNKVAISVIDHLLSSPEFLSTQLPADMKRIYRMRPHPNLCIAYEHIYRPRKVFLISEYHEGTDCVTYMTQKNYSEGNALEIFAQIAEGLQHMHSRGILHRDLHPMCIIVNKDGFTKITDIGLHHSLIPLGEKHSSEKTKHNYDAPEVIKSHKFISKEANMYSAGVVLYEMLHGSVPFTGSKNKLLDAIYDEQMDFRAQVSRRMRLLLKQLMHPDPWRRPTAKEALVQHRTVITEYATLPEQCKAQTKSTLSPLRRPSLEPLKCRSNSLATVRCGSEPIILRSRIPDKKIAYALGVDYSEVCSNLNNAKEIQGGSSFGATQSALKNVTHSEATLHKSNKRPCRKSNLLRTNKSDESQTKEPAIESALSVVPIKYQPSTPMSCDYESEEGDEDEILSICSVFASRPASAESDVSVRVLNCCLSESTVLSDEIKDKLHEFPTPRLKKVGDHNIDGNTAGPRTDKLREWIDKEVAKASLLAALEEGHFSEQTVASNDDSKRGKCVLRDGTKLLINEDMNAEIPSCTDMGTETTASSDTHSFFQDKETSCSGECGENHNSQSANTQGAAWQFINHDEQNPDDGELTTVSTTDTTSKEMLTIGADCYPDSPKSKDEQAQTPPTSYYDSPTEVSTNLSGYRCNSQGDATHENSLNETQTPTDSDQSHLWSKSRLTDGLGESEEEEENSSSNSIIFTPNNSPLETAASYKSDRDSSIPSDLGSLEPSIASDSKQGSEDSDEVIVNQALPLPPFTENERVRSFLAQLARNRNLVKQIQISTNSAAAGDQALADGEISEGTEQAASRKFAARNPRPFATFKTSFWNYKLREDAYDLPGGAPADLSIPTLKGESINIQELPKVRNGAPALDYSLRPNLHVPSKTDSNNKGIKTHTPKQSEQPGPRGFGMVPVSFTEGATACAFDERPIVYHIYRDQIPSAPRRSPTSDISSCTASLLLQCREDESAHDNSSLNSMDFRDSNRNSIRIQRNHTQNDCANKINRRQAIAQESLLACQRSTTYTKVLPPIFSRRTSQRMNTGRPDGLSAPYSMIYSRLGRCGF